MIVGMKKQMGVAMAGADGAIVGGSRSAPAPALPRWTSGRWGMGDLFRSTARWAYRSGSERPVCGGDIGTVGQLGAASGALAVVANKMGREQ